MSAARKAKNAKITKSAKYKVYYDELLATLKNAAAGGVTLGESDEEDTTEALMMSYCRKQAKLAIASLEAAKQAELSRLSS